MSRRLNDLDGHVEVLVRLRRVSGADVYDRALLAARVAVAKVILAEAERAVGAPKSADGKRRSFPEASPQEQWTDPW